MYGSPLPLQSVQADSEHKGRWIELSHITFVLGKASAVLSRGLEGEGSGDAFARGADTADFTGEVKATSESDLVSGATCETTSWSVWMIARIF